MAGVRQWYAGRGTPRVWLGNALAVIRDVIGTGSDGMDGCCVV